MTSRLRLRRPRFALLPRSRRAAPGELDASLAQFVPADPRVVLGGELHPDLVAIRRLLRPHGRRLWLRRIVRRAWIVIAATVLAELVLWTVARFVPLEIAPTLGAVIPIALASDTLSITVMEIVDNAIILIIPGAMEAGLGDIGFWAALAFALLVAGAAAYPVNRWLLARGKGHAIVHQHHAH